MDELRRRLRFAYVQGAEEAGVPVPLIGQPILGIIMVALLLLTYRKYNPSR